MISHFQVKIFRFQDSLNSVLTVSEKSPETNDPVALGVELYPLVLEGKKSFRNGNFTGIQELYNREELSNNSAVFQEIQKLQVEKEEYWGNNETPFFLAWKLTFLFSLLSPEMQEKIQAKYKGKTPETA